MSVETTYQKKTQLEHILLRPDTYVGSTEFQDQQIWVLGSNQEAFENRQIKYVPALYKIFDEILVNAADNYSRDKRMKRLEVVIDSKQNMISVLNDGKGIPVQIHKEYNIYVPELIFGHLLTSSNYNDAEKKVTGGRNGYGAKLTNIFSSKFIVETADSKSKKKFTMTWTKNMSEQSEPQLSPYTESDFTKITFYPDLKKFHMKELDKDITDLMKKRVFDMAGVIGGNVKVSLNGEKIGISSFSDYTDLYLKQQGGEIIKVMDNKGTNNERWEVIASLSEGQFQQVSFVNSICTSKGGTHVNYITDQLTEKLMETLKKKEKNLSIKPFQVKSHMWIFLNCLIENPSFDSQTKETLTLRQQDFGSTCEISEKFIKELHKSNIINHILLQARAKEQAKMAKTLSAKKQNRLLGVPKLEDANDAGTRNGEHCTLIITEGDSAKALAMSGIEVVGRDRYGVFPLKGKMLNVRDSNSKTITDNVEIQNIIKVMGMKINANYENAKALRYGSIMIMADQDHDGSHIKGLFINFIQNFWPSLYKMEGFLKEFITPIVKVTKKNQNGKVVHAIPFYSIQDYKKWRLSCPNAHTWTIKYYKGLGTSTDQEAQEYFHAINKHTINFRYEGKECDDSIDLAFNKKRAEDRKQWLVTYNPEENVDHTQKHLTYKDFVYKELINFSISDNARSIPSLCDGLKPGQRKILYACFKRNLKNEVKVAQLSGYIAEHSAYHHGEMSLAQTIIGMAQNFVGSNNINYLLPIGQFGSRNMGGKEAASARYIHTALNKITRLIFPEPDDHILTYLEDDGQLVEPIYYIPIIPTSLLNGAEGIGTGWSTSVPSYNPRELADSIEKRLLGIPFADLLPWYKGFTGEISNNEKGQITVKGRYRIIDETTIEITELPVNKWIRDFKNFLEEKLESSKDKEPEIEDIKEYHAGNRVHFVIKVSEKQMDSIQKEGFEKYFKLTSTVSTTNMVLFNPEGKIKKFNNVTEIMEEYYEQRYSAYEKRKEYLLSRLYRDIDLLNNKKKFILAVISQKLQVHNVKRKTLVKELVSQGFTQMKDISKVKSIKQAEEKPEQGDEANEDEGTLLTGEVNPKEYDYLLSLPIWSLTYEKVEEIKTQEAKKREEIEKLQGTEIAQLWKEDLNNFIVCLDKLEDDEEKEMQQRIMKGNNKSGKMATMNTKRKKPAQKNQQLSSDDDRMEISDDDNSDFDTGRKKANTANNKKKQAGSLSAPQSQQTKNNNKNNENIPPQISTDTGISSKTNKNNQSTLGFLSQPAAQTLPVAPSKVIKTKSDPIPALKKPLDPLQQLMDKYNEKKEPQKEQEQMTQTSVLSQNYSLSLEERIKMRLGGDSQPQSQQQSSQVLSQKTMNPVVINHITDEDDDEEVFTFKKSSVVTKNQDDKKVVNNKQKPITQKDDKVDIQPKIMINEDEDSLLNEYRELMDNSATPTPTPTPPPQPANANKRQGKTLKKEEPKITKKRIVQQGKKAAVQKKKVESEDENNSEDVDDDEDQSDKSKDFVISDDSDDDFDAMVDENDDNNTSKKQKASRKAKPKETKTNKNTSTKGKATKQTKPIVDDFKNSASKKSVEQVITLSEDEDVEEIKKNKVLPSRTRGKRNPIPKTMLQDSNDDEDDFNDSQDEEEELQPKKLKKAATAAPSKGKKAKKDDDSSEENFF